MTTAVDGSELEGKAKEDFVEDLFNDIAGPYDRLNRVCSFWRDGAWRRKLIGLLGLSEGDTAVDLGTGTGDLALAMLQRVKKNGQIIGIDLSSEMLKVARAKQARLCPNATNLTLSEGNAEATGLDSESADVITMGWVLRNVSDREAVYREVLRVLKPGGRFGVIEMSQPDNRVLQFFSSLYLRFIMPLVTRLAGGSRTAYEYLASSTLRFPKKQAITSEWVNAGLKNVVSTSLMMGTIAIHVGTKESTS